MKRILRRLPSNPGTRILVLDRDRLIAAGSGDLGIAVRVPAPFDPGMQLQHNDLLVRA